MANSGRLNDFAKPELSTAAKTGTRTNLVADATNIPAAMMLRWMPSAARRARWRLTPVEETNPPRNPASKMPRSGPAILTAQ